MEKAIQNLADEIVDSYIQFLYEEYYEGDNDVITIEAFVRGVINNITPAITRMAIESIEKMEGDF